MSYCRFSEGDVYLVKTPINTWTCFECKLDPNQGNKEMSTLDEVDEHLEAHEKAGHVVAGHARIRVLLESMTEIIKEHDSGDN